MLLVAALLWIDPVCAESAAPLNGGGKPETPQLFRDQRHVWNFDSERPGGPPSAFVVTVLGSGSPGHWTIEADAHAPSPPNRLIQEAPCSTPECFQVLLAEGVRYEYPDAAVRLRAITAGMQSAGGIVFGARNPLTFLAAIVDFGSDTLEVIGVVDGQVTVLGREPVKRRKTDWHTLRVQHNTILSKEFLEISFDGEIVFSRWEKAIGSGQVGLVTHGPGPMAFDNFHVVQLYSQRPLSPPAAY